MSGGVYCVGDDLFDDYDARVLCGQMGYDSGEYDTAMDSTVDYGITSQQIWLDNVACTGSESSVSECSHNGSVFFYCFALVYLSTDK